MARVLLGETEVEVSEEVEDIMGRIINSRDGLRRGSGTMVAPPGWVVLTADVTGDEIYIQVANIGYVRED
jgi:cell wall assembly regulator SMI1